MVPNNRREFLADVGRGMLIAGIGPALAADLGLAKASAAEVPDALSFGKFEPLVAFLQDTPTNKLIPALVAKINEGTELRTLIAASALANARTFGGQHYDGYHTFMALGPAFAMSQELPKNQSALPVLKVMYRNGSCMQSVGGRKHEVLHHVKPAETPAGKVAGEVLQTLTRGKKVDEAEGVFAGAAATPAEAFNHVLYCVEDDVNVHRVVLAWRAWSTLEFTGAENAHSLLRQSVRFCCNEHNQNRAPKIQALLPTLLDQYKLVGKKPGTRTADDAWVEALAQVIYAKGREKAADAVAAALAEGFGHEAIGEAMSLAANMLLQHDPGRSKADGAKQKGSVHGDSVGLHASDAANAWRNIARVSNDRNAVASLIVGAYHTAGQNGGQTKDPYHTAELEKIQTTDAKELLQRADDAIKTGNQAVAAAAAAQKYGQAGHPERALLDLLIRYGVSEDGTLHAEKYYRTATEEFAAARPAFRWRQLVSLARVTASEHGRTAPGYEEAKKLLGV